MKKFSVLIALTLTLGTQAFAASQECEKAIEKLAPLGMNYGYLVGANQDVTDEELQIITENAQKELSEQLKKTKSVCK